MDIGLGLPQLGRFAHPDALRTVAVEAERAGFASLWTRDRILAPVDPRTPCPQSADGTLPPEQGTAIDPLIALAAAAAVTESIRIGTSVLVAPLYSPVLLARSAASLDRLSDGRFTLGLGLGWSVDEYEAVGVRLARRQVRIEEMLEVMARVWRDEVVEIETSHERIAPSTIGLKPVRGPRVPLLLAASTPAGLERIARRADGWHPTGVRRELIGPMWAEVLEIAERYGRDPEQLRLVVRADVRLTTEDAGPDRPEFTGSIRQVGDDLCRTAELGAHELVLDLQGTAGSSAELLDRALTLTAALTAATP